MFGESIVCYEVFDVHLLKKNEPVIHLRMVGIEENVIAAAEDFGNIDSGYFDK